MFDVPALRIIQTSSQLEYQITDPSGQQELGRAAQVAGPKPRNRLISSMFGSGVGDGRVAVQVFWPDGTPSFYLDRQPGSSIDAPIAILAPDGALIGRLLDDRTIEMQQMIARGIPASGARHMTLRWRSAMSHRLLDAADRELCRLEWMMEKRSNHEGLTVWRPVACDFTDMNGVVVARMDVAESFQGDRYDLRFHYQLPEPLRTLTIATPLAFDLARSD